MGKAERHSKRINFAVDALRKTANLSQSIQLRKGRGEVHYDFPKGSEHTSLLTETCKVGVYAGSFDPVHAGHIIFALKAQKLAGLDQVCFVPERRPLRNPDPEHYVHRIVMLGHALKPHQQFTVHDIPDARLTATSFERLKQELPANSEFSLLMSASDFLWYEGDLPKLFERLPMVVAVTTHAQLAEVLERIHASGQHFQNVSFVDIGSDHISSSAIRSGLRQGRQVRGLLPSVMHYARRQWLYINPHRG
jgi:nicotinate-nucleotide adenylyltransferase